MNINLLGVHAKAESKLHKFASGNDLCGGVKKEEDDEGRGG